MNGKGDRDRSDRKKYAAGWSRIFERRRGRGREQDSTARMPKGSRPKAK